MKSKYCLPIIKNTKSQVLLTLKTKGYDYFEVWLDYIQDLDEQFISKLAEELAGKIIFVIRHQNLENIELPLDKRISIISALSKFNVMLDLDLLTQQKELDFLKQNNSSIKLILSYHNYRKTPELSFLEKLINKMKKYNPDILKISTFCQKEKDGLNLLNLLLKLKKQKLKYIVLGMGKTGLITRIFGPVWGNELSFTPENLNEKSAEGQLTKSRLQSILQEIS